MIEKSITELYRIFDLFNKNLFEDKLEKPVILISPRHKKRTLGTCSVNKIWKNKLVESDTRYEITISAEHLKSSTYDICETILHEMIHLHCSLNNIKDTSNNYIYHNKNYKKEAEDHGLNVEKGQTVGYAYTSLKPQTKELVDSFNVSDEVFKFFRDIIEKPKIKAVRYKYICPDCEKKISHYKEINLKCGDCDKNMELVV